MEISTHDACSSVSARASEVDSLHRVTPIIEDGDNRVTVPPLHSGTKSVCLSGVFNRYESLCTHNRDKSDST